MSSHLESFHSALSYGKRSLLQSPYASMWIIRLCLYFWWGRRGREDVCLGALLKKGVWVWWFSLVSLWCPLQNNNQLGPGQPLGVCIDQPAQFPLGFSHFLEVQKWTSSFCLGVDMSLFFAICHLNPDVMPHMLSVCRYCSNIFLYLPVFARLYCSEDNPQISVDYENTALILVTCYTLPMCQLWVEDSF